MSVLKEAYKLYKIEKAKTKEKPVRFSTFIKICELANKEIVERCLEGDTVNFPHGVGMLSIKKRKTNYNNLKIDYKATAEEGKKIYHTNLHSDGYYALFVWKKNLFSIHNAYWYKFKIAWGNKSKVAKVLKEPKGHLKFYMA